MSHGPGSGSAGGGQLTPTTAVWTRKEVFDYAWKWFVFHADQRTKVFNFMILTFGIFATGVVTALDKKMNVIAMMLSVLAFVLAVIFLLLDFRNRNLVWLGEDVLRDLEKNEIFKDQIIDKNAMTGLPPQLIQYGLLFRQQREDSQDNWLRGDLVTMGVRNAVLGRHRLLFPAVSVLMSLLFLGLFGCSLAQEFTDLKHPRETKSEFLIRLRSQDSNTN